eukprot:Polyplicarium_translucidae@DN3250_c0_g1_i2.p2
MPRWHAPAGLVRSAPRPPTRPVVRQLGWRRGDTVTCHVGWRHRPVGGMFVKVVMDTKCVNAIRCLGAALPDKAKSGHPGAPMGCAPMAHALFAKVMRYSAKNPLWWNRDRFVLSNGHASSLQYAMLHLSGFGVSKDDLRNFRQLGSKTPGHPEAGVTPGVEVTTELQGAGIASRVVSLPCWELFLEQPEKYRRELLALGDSSVTVRVYVEAAIAMGFADMGFDRSISMTTFGVSAPRDDAW